MFRINNGFKEFVNWHTSLQKTKCIFYIFLAVISFVASTNFFISPVFAATNASGDLTGHTVWTVSGSPYVFTGTVLIGETCVYSGSSCTGVYTQDELTIEPGVTVDLNGYDLRTYGGILNANGATFVSSNSGSPDILVDYQGSIGTNHFGGRATIENCTFADSTGVIDINVDASGDAYPHLAGTLTLTAIRCRIRMR